MCDSVIISRLKDLKRHSCNSGYEDTCDMEEDETYGKWINEDDIKAIIDEFEEKP